VDLDDRVIDVDQHPLSDSCDHWCGRAQGGQEPGGDRVELADVAEREGAQKRAQCRGCVGPVEDPAHGAVAQQCHVIDAVASGDHPCDQRHHLVAGVGALVAWHAQMLVSQAGQPSVLGKFDYRDQPCGRHEIRIIEDC